MPQDILKDLHFPKAGIDVSVAAWKQRNRPVEGSYARTTPVGINVRGYDRSGRSRGGCRPGLLKSPRLPLTQVNGETWVVQELSTLISSGSGLSLGLVAAYTLDTTLQDASGNANHLIGSSPTYQSGLIGQELATGSASKKPLVGLSSAGMTLSAWFYATNGSGAGGGTGFGQGTEVGEALRIAYRSNGANGKIVVRNRAGTDLISTGFTYTLDTRIHAVVSWNGTTARLTVNGVSIGTSAFTGGTNWHKLTFGIDTAGADFTSPVDEVYVYNRAITAAEITQLYNAGAGARPFTTTGTGVQPSQSGRVVTLLAVSQGVVKTAVPGDTSWTTPTNNTGEEPALNFTGVIDSAANQQKMYFVDGINYVYFDPSTNSIELWTIQYGDALPTDADGNTARLIETWRGRTLLAGIIGDPQVLFASAVANPRDFDYEPLNPSPTQAFATTASLKFGQVGDSITALIPWSDDVLLIGCDHTMVKVTGDPADGGRIDKVSETIGCAFGRAWCIAPDGTVFWISNRTGIYSMVPGPQPVPQRLSSPIDPLIADLDMGGNIFRMIWDDRQQGFHLFITWVDEPMETTHYFYEHRTQAWWQDKFANLNHNPLCCAVYDGNDPDDRLLLTGGWDGYVRVIDFDAADDDGTPIESRVMIGPLLTPNMDEVTLVSAQGVFGQDSADVQFDVQVGKTAEEAVEADPILAVRDVFSEGRGYTKLVNRSGHAIYTVLSSVGQWAMESLRIAMRSTLSRIRMRRNG